MEITIIHGQMHKGSDYHITEMIKEKLVNGDAVVNEFFMPKDTPDFCVGCYQCILKGENKCPQFDKVQKILSAMLRSQLIIINSPSYCLEMTGQLKTLFDHLAYIWMPHRPRKEMFSKTAIAISTAAGAGADNVTKTISKQLFWWGVPKIYRLHFNVGASRWEDVSDKTKKKIAEKVDLLVPKVKREIGNVKPNIKTKFMFNIMRKMQTANNWNQTDKDYWKNNNWLKKKDHGDKKYGKHKTKDYICITDAFLRQGL